MVGKVIYKFGGCTMEKFCINEQYGLHYGCGAINDRGYVENYCGKVCKVYSECLEVLAEAKRKEQEEIERKKAKKEANKKKQRRKTPIDKIDFTMSTEPRIAIGIVIIDETKLIDCSECTRGGNGDMSCEAGKNKKKPHEGKCKRGTLLPHVYLTVEEKPLDFEDWLKTAGLILNYSYIDTLLEQYDEYCAKYEKKGGK